MKPKITPPGKKIVSFYAPVPFQERLRTRARELGYESFSEYLRATLECGLEIPHVLFGRLREQAGNEGVPVATLLARVLTRELRARLKAPKGARASLP